MRSLVDRLGRRRPTELAEWGDWVWPVGMVAADPQWNSIGTLAAGPIADVDAAGAVADRRRPVLLDLWIKAGHRWVHPARDPSVRQRRIDGLPVIETRVRAGAHDVVLTAWADEGGDGRGRLLVSVENPGDEPIAVATVVRPFTIVGRGEARSIRVAERLIVVDGRPLVVLPKQPVDIAIGSADLGDVHERLVDELVADDAVDAPDGSATLAAVWPLGAGATETVAMIDGRAAIEAVPTPVDRIIAGWKAHLADAATVALPEWPDHLWPSLLSGLLLRVEEATPPKGSNSPRRDDIAVAAALALAGLPRAAAIELERLLDAMTDGSITRDDWPAVAAACGRLVGSASEAVLAGHGPTVTAAIGELLSYPLASSARHELLQAVAVAAGDRAAADAAEIVPIGTPPLDRLDALARLGVELTPDLWTELDDARPTGDSSVGDLAFQLTLGARRGPSSRAGASRARAADVVTAVRAGAGATWSWAGDGAGDSPYARAALVIGLRSAAVREGEALLDLAPGFTDRWLGRNVDVSGLPTTWGTLSYSLRWHGARPALLWELDPAESGRAIGFTAAAIDPGFSATSVSGETLLAAPRTAP